MVAAKEFIVAIELGSSKMTGIAGQKNLDGSINVLDNGTMEFVPRVGDHIIYIGTPNSIDKKLERLRKFYLYGLNKAGWNKYNYISLEFDNQIICKKNSKKKI